MQGWWAELASTERKFTSRIGSPSAITEAKIILSEQSGDDNYEAPKQWPDDQLYRPSLSVRAVRDGQGPDRIRRLATRADRGHHPYSVVCVG